VSDLTQKEWLAEKASRFAKSRKEYIERQERNLSQYNALLSSITEGGVNEDGDPLVVDLFFRILGDMFDENSSGISVSHLIEKGSYTVSLKTQILAKERDGNLASILYGLEKELSGWNGFDDSKALFMEEKGHLYLRHSPQEPVALDILVALKEELSSIGIHLEVKDKNSDGTPQVFTMLTFSLETDEK